MEGAGRLNGHDGEICANDNLSHFPPKETSRSSRSRPIG
ncbi:hypothetical protein AvCA_40950 [Azotobacter vinelandii CA]|uniref:Uncharacterized protein n=2 Tax=Azotobacter vinelandii TaxID=354 RepID=C1DEQ1_AZOVD|nr:hypothetical protein Avin_40950 [Azotobacter vinelandii DJ]AGK14449.1 hypothetical protein AvCA_40950 [Azotobacter vinelandii CA]AGK21784.1 hypothetical protein AvCA6_40950 [Azotobacter vinelandii CA6]